MQTTFCPISRRCRAVMAYSSGFTSGTMIEPGCWRRAGITADTPFPPPVGLTVMRCPSPAYRSSALSSTRRPSGNPSGAATSRAAFPQRAVPCDPDTRRSVEGRRAAVTATIATMLPAANAIRPQPGRQPRSAARCTGHLAVSRATPAGGPAYGRLRRSNKAVSAWYSVRPETVRVPSDDPKKRPSSKTGDDGRSQCPRRDSNPLPCD